jgi:ribosomal protein S18 acetylase RimI-like enzyme
VVEITVAQPHQLDDVLAVLDDAAAWLQAIGVSEQWPPSFSADVAWVERFTGWIAAGYVYLACDADGAAIGCFRLMNEDTSIWQDASGRHVYLHSLAVRRTAAGGDVASAMLDFALQYAAAQGAEELRLDCWAGNQRLVKYYEDAGFEHRGLHHVDISGAWGKQDYYVAKFAKKAGA